MALAYVGILVPAFSTKLTGFKEIVIVNFNLRKKFVLSNFIDQLMNSNSLELIITKIVKNIS